MPVLKISKTLKVIVLTRNLRRSFYILFTKKASIKMSINRGLKYFILRVYNQFLGLEEGGYYEASDSKSAHDKGKNVRGAFVLGHCWYFACRDNRHDEQDQR
ncbi:hypothetical protein EDC56_0493 [Sinobacterium caligoides]|uniref:Uncharacterized protein n=1 Tax=Sinobacterium caligoides TaxID=933926 RepID=A0A3N2E074_9GAMM|nr:hypothetical protein EDC56_0493 [Sinobacterium caligoides]